MKRVTAAQMDSIMCRVNRYNDLECRGIPEGTIMYRVKTDLARELKVIRRFLNESGYDLQFEVSDFMSDNFPSGFAMLIRKVVTCGLEYKVAFDFSGCSADTTTHYTIDAI